MNSNSVITSYSIHYTKLYDIIDVLAVGVALRRGPELAQRLEKTKRILTEKHLL